MSLKSIINLIIRIFSLNLFLKSIWFLLSATTTTLAPEEFGGRGFAITANILLAAAYFLLGLSFFKFDSKITDLIGSGLNVEEKIDSISLKSIIPAAYCFIGIYLIVFAIPGLIPDVIKLYNGERGLGRDDSQSIMIKSRIWNSVIEISLGILLIKFKSHFPPHNAEVDELDK